MSELELFEPLDLNADFDDTDAEYITLKGKIFEAGEFPDKNFSLTPEELKAAVTDFQPVPVDYAHTAGPLDGKLGQLEAVEVAEDGTTLLGTVKVPKWLDTALGASARKVSCTWNRATKRLEKLALVTNPRIPDAELLSAFTADFEGRRHNSGDYSTIQGIHDAAQKLGAECHADYKSDDPNPDTKELNKMSEPTQPTTPEKGSAAFDQATFDALNAKIARLESEKRRREAESFADSQITAKKAMPAERASLVALFEQALADDEASPAQVTFAEGKQPGSRADAIRAMFDARKEHKLTEELVKEAIEKGETITALFAAQEKKPDEVDTARRKQLMGLTPLGLEVIKGKN